VKNIYQIDYTGAAKLDDVLTIENYVTEVTKASAKMRQNAKLIGPEKILVTAELRLICASAESLKPIRLPTTIKEKLEL
jgi:acyl-CoA thioesterase FadM